MKPEISRRRLIVGAAGAGVLILPGVNARTSLRTIQTFMQGDPT